MVIQHNMPAINSLGKLSVNTANVEKVSEQLASGFRINRAADDAAGLAVSEKMRSQLAGLKQASRNCQDGINIAQTFEGALSESHSIIKRCKELAMEAANGNYDNPTDRAAIELEYRQLCDEINAISDTDYNGVVMLNGGKLACAKNTELGWLDPINVKWAENSLINMTDDPNFYMQISKLPALDEMTIITEDEYRALEQFNSSKVIVDIDNGSASFKFAGDPIPEGVSIDTRGNTGYVSLNSASGPVEIAKITLPNVQRAVTTSGKGVWGTSSQEFKGIITPPSVILPTPNAGAANKAVRQAYDTWIRSVPTVTFKVSDDLQSFTISSGGNNVKDHTPDKVYNINDSVTLLSTPPCDTNPVTWNPDIVKPGATFSVYGSTYSEKPVSTAKYKYNANGSTARDPSGNPICYSKRFATVSAAKNRQCFLDHGSESFTVTYKDNHPDKGTWSLRITNYDTSQDSTGGTVSGTTFTTDDQAVITKYLDELGVSLSSMTSSMENELSAARTDGKQFTSIYDYKGAPNGYIPMVPNDTYTFSFSISAPGTVRGYPNAWNPNGTATVLNMKEYDPNNPERGGVDYDVATVGNVYTYHNDMLVDRLDPGYWVDQDGNVVELEEEGIYLPDEKNRGNSNDILHDGLTITVGERISGATGKSIGEVQLWQPGEEPFTPIPNDDLQGLTYAENMVLQTNARTKDSVNFTFVYNSGAQGELICDLNCSAKGLGMSGLDLTTQISANIAIDRLDYSLNKISMVRACFGAVQNRLEHKIDNISVTHENITASESQIRDTDMAQTMIDLTRSQILQQSAQSMLAQANQLPQSTLQLLG